MDFYNSALKTRMKFSGLFFEKTNHQKLIQLYFPRSIINKLEEHDDFFPAFQTLIEKLLHVLGKNVCYVCLYFVYATKTILMVIKMLQD